MSSAYHNEALRKTRVLEKNVAWGEEGLHVTEAKVSQVKSVPDVDYLRELEVENRDKCKKRYIFDNSNFYF